jgi:hypothetical protein
VSSSESIRRGYRAIEAIMLLPRLFPRSVLLGIMAGVGWYSQQISLNFLNLVKFYICKPKSTGRGSLIKKQTIFIYLL